MAIDTIHIAAESSFGPGENISSDPPPSKGGPAKNIYIKSERLTPGHRVTRSGSERSNLYSSYILPRNTKTYATQRGPRNLYRILSTPQVRSALTT
jgi:hypothetical protein